MNITHENTIKHEDTVLIAVMTKYHERSKKGLRKYGTNLDRTDVDLLGWLDHLQEELMDATLYIEKLKADLKQAQKAALINLMNADKGCACYGSNEMHECDCNK